MTLSQITASILIGASISAAPAFANALSKDEAIKFYNWSGRYAGLNVGAVKHVMSMTDDQAVTFNATIQQVANPQFTGGFQIGYRHQLAPTTTSGVYGLEFSANFSNATFSKDYGSSYALYQLSSNNALKDTLLLQLIGGIAADRALLFLAAGGSWINITGNVVNQSGLPFFDAFSVSKKTLALALGCGVEYAINERVSARVKVDVISPNTYMTNDDTGNTYQIANNIIQGTFGVNYKFG
ncbi:MAG: outer membrane protein [Legionellales bacterium]